MNNVERGFYNNHIGSVSEAAILYSLVRAGFNVLKPWSNSSRFDFAIELDGQFWRIQCKTGTLTNNIICFRPFSTSTNGKRKGYRHEADFFFIYCKENGKIYFIDVANCASSRKVKFYLNPKSKQAKKAESYEFRGIIS